MLVYREVIYEMFLCAMCLDQINHIHHSSASSSSPIKTISADLIVVFI
jgi:hypothetical protein